MPLALFLFHYSSHATPYLEPLSAVLAWLVFLWKHPPIYIYSERCIRSSTIRKWSTFWRIIHLLMGAASVLRFSSLIPQSMKRMQKIISQWLRGYTATGLVMQRQKHMRSWILCINIVIILLGIFLFSIYKAKK